jgi:hypothetical protein
MVYGTARGAVRVFLASLSVRQTYTFIVTMCIGLLQSYWNQNQTLSNRRAKVEMFDLLALRQK